MRHRPSDGGDVRLVARELCERFLPNADTDVLRRLVQEYLDGVQKPLPPNDFLAIGLAKYLAKQPIFNTTEIRRLIKNRPLEFAAAVESSDWDEYSRIAKAITSGSIRSKPTEMS